MNLQQKANELRKLTFETITHAGGEHYGGSLSVIEILTVLHYDVMYRADEPEAPDRDRFILCKGHAGPALYVVLADKGIIDKKRLAELDQNGGSLPKHIDRMKVRGIEFSAGPLGQGLSVACGMAITLKEKYPDTYVYAVLGDGECNEGQVWEAAMLAAQYHLDNLIAVVDYNKCQIDGRVSDVIGLEPFADKWRAFGWHVLECDGHDTADLKKTFAKAKLHEKQPVVVIAHTKKGKGVSVMEDNYVWHSGKITPEQFAVGKRDLERSVG